MSSNAYRRPIVMFAAVALLVAVTGVASGQSDKTAAAPNAGRDWPQFLGPDRNGISAETGLLTSWPADGPTELWRVAGGVGMSGLAIKDGRLFTLAHKAGRQQVICLDARTGAPNWERELAPMYRNPQGDGPRATPAVAGEIVYAFTGEGVLAALKAADGQVVWKKDVVTELGGKPAEYGMACSPLVVGDRVIVTIGAPGATVVALEGRTGAVAWSAGKNLPAGYSSPAVLKVANRDQLVVFHGAGAFGLDPSNGKQLWDFSYVTDFDCNIATPLAVEGNVFLSSGENRGSVLLSLKSSGETFGVGQVWSSHGSQSVLRNEWQTSILSGGNLYGFDNVGSAGPVTHLACVEAATGKRLWQQLRFGKGNLIAADGKLFISTFAGDLVVLKVNPMQFEEMGRKQVVGKTRQAPSLAGGLLYLRDDRDIVCVDIRRK
jgi:outer membrane protein assembly factor BamB